MLAREAIEQTIKIGNRETDYMEMGEEFFYFSLIFLNILIVILKVVSSDSEPVHFRDLVHCLQFWLILVF